MARELTAGFEGTLTGDGWDSSTGTIATSTLQKYGGAQSARANPTSGTGFLTETVYGGGGGEFGVYIRFYLRIATAPGVSCDIVQCGDGTTFNPTFRLETNRTLRMYNAGAAIGTASAALNLDQWYAVEFYYDDRNSGGDLGNNTSAFRLNGTLVSTAATADMVGWNTLRLGVITSTTADLYFDDVAINDQTGNQGIGWPGLIDFEPSAQWLQKPPGRISPASRPIVAVPFRIAGRLNVALVTAGTTGAPAPAAQDVSMADDLELNGFNVGYLSSADNLPDAGWDVLVVTESGSSSSAAINTVDTCLLPVMFQETTANTALLCLNATVNPGGSPTTWDVQPAGEGHPITAGMTDATTIFSSAQGLFGSPLTELPVGASALACHPVTTTSACLWVVEKGGTLTTGVAPARRCYWPYVGTGRHQASTTAMRDAFKRAVVWLAGASVPATEGPEVFLSQYAPVF